MLITCFSHEIGEKDEDECKTIGVETFFTVVSGFVIPNAVQQQVFMLSKFSLPYFLIFVITCFQLDIKCKDFIFLHVTF